MSKNIQLYEEQPIRTAWDEEKEEWYFSVVDVVGVLTDQPDSRHAAKYWSVLKVRLKKEGNQLTTNCRQLKMTAEDGKKRLTDVANTEQLLRIIQSIPSPKAEPFKLWLARVGAERIEETIDPEQAIDRALETYQKKGYSDEWIHQRILSIRVRNALTDEWQKSGVQQGREYAILTDEITKAWSGMSTRQYKKLKGLKKENLRDNMSDMELILNMLAESTSTEISKKQKPTTFEENMQIARKRYKGDIERRNTAFEENMQIARSGGEAAGEARKAVEKRTGVPVITAQNAAQLNAVVTNVIEDVAEMTKKDDEYSSDEE